MTDLGQFAVLLLIAPYLFGTGVVVAWVALAYLVRWVTGGWCGLMPADMWPLAPTTQECAT